MRNESFTSLIASGRKIFNTTIGRIGLVPPTMRPGDKVGVFKGAEALYILRPVPQEKRNAIEQYEARIPVKYEDLKKNIKYHSRQSCKILT